MPGPNRHTEGLIDFSDVVASTTATNGEIRVNLGDSTTGAGIDRSVPFWGIDGFLSRPLNPDADGAAQYLYFCDGNQRHAIGSRDRRNLSLAGNIDVGDRVIYSPSGIRIFCDDSEQSITVNVPGGGVLFLADNEFRVTLGNGAQIELTETSFNVSLPTAIETEFTLNSSGAVISTKNAGQTIHLDANSFVTLGLTGGITRPSIASVENVNIGPGAGATVPSPKVFAASV
jgi:hypothetical protein